MNEKNDISIDEVPSKTNERNSVGGALHKQRVSMNLSIEKISKDLRIRKTYIEAIENDRYDEIPAATYVRVYVKTIAEYLSLDATKLLKQLSAEESKLAGLSDNDLYSSDRNTALISINEPGKGKAKKFWFIAVAVILLLVGTYFIVSQNAYLSTYQNEFVDVDTFEIITDEQAPDSLEYDHIPDSLIRGDTIIETDSIPAVPADTVAVQQDTTVAVTPERFEIVIRALRDTATVMAVSDGIIVYNRQIRSADREITVSAADSINIYSYNGSRAIDIFRAGKKINKAGSRGIWTLTRDATRNLTVQEWQQVKRVEQ